MEERRSVLSCECQFVIGSYSFPEDLRDPESSTCPADFSIPVDAGRPPFVVNVIREASFVKRETESAFLRDTLHVSQTTCLIDAHHTAQGKRIPEPVLFRVNL